MLTKTDGGRPRSARARARRFVPPTRLSRILRFRSEVHLYPTGSPARLISASTPSSPGASIVPASGAHATRRAPDLGTGHTHAPGRPPSPSGGGPVGIASTTSSRVSGQRGGAPSTTRASRTARTVPVQGVTTVPPSPSGDSGPAPALSGRYRYRQSGQ